jgi:hypothetical protein
MRISSSSLRRWRSSSCPAANGIRCVNPRRQRVAVTDQVRDGVAQWDDGGDGIAQPTGTGACTGASTKS